MIKRYMPKWNVLLRDDKTVSYIRINFQDKIPHVSITRTPLDDGAKYVGPFYGKSAIERSLRILRKIFPFYDRPYTGRKTLNTDLGLTPGIEINQTTPTLYKRNLRKLVRYLEGGRHKLLKDLKKQMDTLATAGKYEQAAEARDQYFGLRELERKIVFSDKEFLDLSADRALSELQALLRLPEPPRRIEGYDVSHQSGTNVVAAMVVFTNGVANRSAYRKFKIKQDQNDDFANLREVLARRLKHTEWPCPDLILIDGGEPQLRAIYDILSPTGIPYFGLAEQPETIVVPKNSTQVTHFQAPRNSHIIKLVQRIRDEAHRFAITYHTLLKRKNMLK